MAGITVFLDAHIDRAEGAEGTGLTADSIDECDWIVIGHSHFDHLYGAERIMAQTKATRIGSSNLATSPGPIFSRVFHAPRVDP